ncbi:MAG TPA: nucleotidyltransferase family protein [Steroidobacteraceae bacterium]|nr:nucleotidyltransferase family protein [Steroidobacteraceae bacterium]
MSVAIRESAAPPPKALQVTLRKITETLAHELASPTATAPDWTEIEWMVARAVAAMHGVSPLLSSTLRWQGPDGWMQFLAQQRTHTESRQERLGALLQRIDEIAREAGIAAVALKGAALHAMQVYVAGDRPMADIDLLVRPADAERTARMLERMGYYESWACWKERAFVPIDGHTASGFGEHSGNDLKIELHERICERLPWHITDVSGIMFPPEPHPGLNAYPSKASLMTHLLLHAAGSMAFQSLRLLHLHDLAQLASRMTDTDWDTFVESSARGERFWWAYPPLKLTSRYFPARIPDRVLEALANDCPYLLERASRHQTLYDVSFSYLWVDAFPGIEWSRSLREILVYAAKRVWPDSKHLAGREHVAKCEPWASQAQWSHLSQGRRILRWLTSRQTRTLTMHAVRSALAQSS